MRAASFKFSCRCGSLSTTTVLSAAVALLSAMAVALFIVAIVLYLLYRVLKWLWLNLFAPEETKQRYGNSGAIIVQEGAAWDRSTLDLHGYNLATTYYQLPRFLNLKQKEYEESNFHKDYQMVHIITGRGAHSLNEQPVLKPAVEEFLINNNYKFNWDVGGGVVRVFLPRRRHRLPESDDIWVQPRRRYMD